MITKEQLERLYNKGLSMMEIAKRERCSHSSIRYWMGRHDIPRRSWSEATYVKRNPNGDPFRIKQRLNKSDILLRGLGLGLYWGEGDKSANNTQFRISNTDPFLIKKFREFLIKICGVRIEKIKYSLVIFNDGNKLKAINFWKKYLKIKKNQLGKVINIPSQGKGTYKEKNQFGVITITVSNKKLKEKILEQIKQICRCSSVSRAQNW